MRFIVIALILSVGLVSFGYAQKCYDYHKSNCTPPNSKFIYGYNSNSISFEFKNGESHEASLELYAGKDYRISICMSDVFGEVVNFKILTKNGNVLYDNKDNNYSLNMEFAAKQSQQVTMHVEVPQTSGEVQESVGCVGIYVEDMVSIRTGF